LNRNLSWISSELKPMRGSDATKGWVGAMKITPVRQYGIFFYIKRRQAAERRMSKIYEDRQNCEMWGVTNMKQLMM
jgi:hypothetical protein